MLIIKDGISRDIDEKNLQVYRDKGYSVVVEAKEPEQPKKKPIGKMTIAELEAKAVELGADISGCKNNAERAEKIFAAQEGGE